MIESAWIAFGCGLLIGSCLGVLVLGFVNINRDSRQRDQVIELDNRVEELLAQRTALKQEIFRVTKKSKLQPRKRRPYKKIYKK